MALLDIALLDCGYDHKYFRGKHTFFCGQSDDFFVSCTSQRANPSSIGRGDFRDCVVIIRADENICVIVDIL